MRRSYEILSIIERWHGSWLDVRHVDPVTERGVLFTHNIVGIFEDGNRLAGEKHLVSLKIHGLEKPNIRWNNIANEKLDDVSRNGLGVGNMLELTTA